MTIALRPVSSRRWEYLPEFALAQVPRYTSYPPANRFSPAVNAETALEALARLPPRSSLSLYLHVPFCKKLCWYCGCHTSVPTTADPVASYVDALVQEVERVGCAAPQRADVTHVHFGGGSPDILKSAQIERLFAALRGAFRIAPSAEIAAELDPRGVKADMVEAFAAGGLTRASLGVQVLDPSVQQRINRVQPKGQIELAVAILRSAGIANLNMDMMYGLPGETLDHVVETASFAASQDANRVATFGYAHVPWMKKHQKSIATSDLPGGEQRFRQAEAAAETLERAGYISIGFDHFAAPGDSLAIAEREGRLRRNFQGYTDDAATALIGFGASAISCLPSVIYQNTTDTAAYRETVSRGELPVARGVSLTDDDCRIARLIERILCDFEADVPADLLIAACPRLSAMQHARLVELFGLHLTVTTRGRPYVRNIASCFDPDFSRAPARHSIAV
jgi:oxygen-independent coproporphyrinogen III oxidase